MLDLIVLIPDHCLSIYFDNYSNFELSLSFSVKIFCFCFTVYVELGSQEPYKTSCSIY